jgi:serine/threonine protein kinase
VYELGYQDDYLTMKMPRYHATLQYNMDVNWFQIFWDVISGLVYLHNALHVIHYDIKLDNICMTKDQRGILIDYGHARMQSHSSLWVEEYHVRYRPPELQEVAGMITRHCNSDIWALGILWLEVLLQKEIIFTLGLLYSYYKPGWWRYNQLRKIMSKEYCLLSYEQIYWYLTRDYKEVYLQFLDLYFPHDKLWKHVIRPMLRYDPQVRSSATMVYCNMLSYHRSLGSLSTAIPPPLITMPRHALRNMGPIVTQEEMEANQLIKSVMYHQGKYKCEHPKVTLELLSRLQLVSP